MCQILYPQLVPAPYFGLSKVEIWNDEFHSISQDLEKNISWLHCSVEAERHAADIFSHLGNAICQKQSDYE